MSTLTYTHGELAESQTQAGKPVRQGFWRRVFDAIVASQQRRAEREIAQFIASRGGLLNDQMEREIMQRLAGNSRTKAV